jgi:hypothetical protein
MKKTPHIIVPVYWLEAERLVSQSEWRKLDRDRDRMTDEDYNQGVGFEEGRITLIETLLSPTSKTPFKRKLL